VGFDLLIPGRGLFKSFIELIRIDRKSLSLFNLTKYLKANELYSEQAKAIRKNKRFSEIDRLLSLLYLLEETLEDDEFHKLLNFFSRGNTTIIPPLTNNVTVSNWAIEAIKIDKIEELPEQIKKAPTSASQLMVVNITRDFIMRALARTMEGKVKKKFKCLRENFYFHYASASLSSQANWDMDSKLSADFVEMIEGCSIK
jgi:hypothetical protein